MAERPTKKRHAHVDVELDLTTLLNVFIILIPFLLLTAVFAKTAIIDVYLPQEGSAEPNPDQPPPPPPKLLIVKLLDGGFELQGIGQGVTVPKDGENYNYGALSRELAKIKDAHPRQEEIVLLFGKNVPYDLVIKVMDAARGTNVRNDGNWTHRTLFPSVSLGEVN